MSLLKAAVDSGGSDVYIVPGAPVTVKIGTSLKPLAGEKLDMAASRALIESAYQMAGARDPQRLLEKGDDDFSF